MEWQDTSKVQVYKIEISIIKKDGNYKTDIVSVDVRQRTKMNLFISHFNNNLS